MRPEGRVEIQGLKSFQAELRSLSKDLPKELRPIHLKAANLVAPKAAASFASRRGVSSAVAASVKAMAQQRVAIVRIGGSGKAASALGAEFGGGKYRKGNPSPAGGYTSQFEPWRGNGARAGYSLFPALRSSTDEIVDLYGDALEDLARRAFPD